MHSATGQQFILSATFGSESLTANISSVGAALRSFKVNGREHLEPGNGDSISPWHEGIVMAPWVNRLEDGAWTHKGKRLEVPITIHSQQNANHGFLVYYPYEVVHQTASKVTLSATIFPRSGYPFLVDTTVTYELVEHGMKVTHTALNHSAEAAPYVVGAHAYFMFEGFSTGDCILTSGAKTLLEPDERQLPIGKVPTAGTYFDLSEGIELKRGHIDHGFTDLPRDTNGFAHTTLNAPNGETIDVWQDQNFGHLVLFTPDFYYRDEDGPRMHAVAIEPQTGGANAFNTGEDLIHLEAGRPWAGSWGFTIRK